MLEMKFERREMLQRGPALIVSEEESIKFRHRSRKPQFAWVQSFCFDIMELGINGVAESGFVHEARTPQVERLRPLYAFGRLYCSSSITSSAHRLFSH